MTKPHQKTTYGFLQRFFFILFIILAIGIVAVALSIGPSRITLVTFFQNPIPMHKDIILLRALRVGIAFITGCALATSGCVFQSLLKNPLADPYILGVSSGAACGATIAIVTDNPGYITAAAFLGGLFTVSIIFTIARRINFHPTAIILSGIALTFVLSSSVLLLFALAKPEKIHKTLMWLSGDISMARFDYIIPFTCIAVVLIALTMFFHRQLDIISFGTHFAATHGIHTHILLLYWIASFITSITVAVTGIIGFIGLVIPHAVRIFKAEHAFLIPVAAIAGGSTLVIADTIGRIIALPYEIPSGVITGFFGGIFFVFLLLSRKDTL